MCASAWTLASCDAGPQNVVEGVEAPIVLLPSDVQILGSTDVIATVQDLDVLPDGTVWVLNTVEPLFVAFDPRGNVVATHGNLGGGPKEFQAPAGFVLGGIAGEAWILDRQRHAFIRVSQPEAPWNQISLPADSLPLGTVIGGLDLMSPGIRTARLGDAVIVPRSTGSMAAGMLSFWYSIWAADLFALNLETESAQTVLALTTVLGDPTGEYQPTGEFPPFPLWPRLWTVCSDNQIRVFDRGRNEVRGFDIAGSEVESLALPPVQSEGVSRREFAGAVFGLAMAQAQGQVGGSMSESDSLRLLNELVERLEGSSDQLAAHLPRYVDLGCSDDGVVWIQPFDIDVGGLKGGTAWLRLGTDGSTQEIHFPDRFDPLRFTAQRIWGVQRDAFDVPAVAWVETPSSK